jgi:hypothetical protein
VFFFGLASSKNPDAETLRESVIGENSLAWSEMFIVIRFSPIPTSASGIGYRRYHFFLFKHLLPSPFTDVEGDRLSTMSVCDTCHETKLPFTDTGEDRCSTIEVFRVIPFHLLIPSDVES